MWHQPHARCLGVYAGAAIGSLGCLVPGFDLALRPRAVLLLGLLPTLVTIGLEVSGLWSVGNVVRGAAGLPLGLAAAFVLAPRLRVHY